MPCVKYVAGITGVSKQPLSFVVMQWPSVGDNQVFAQRRRGSQRVFDGAFKCVTVIVCLISPRVALSWRCVY